MAKKKEEEMQDDDWFEDDDWEEEEKPKKKAVKGKKKNYTWAWILGFIVILIILLLIRYKFSAPDAPVNDSEEETMPEPEYETEYVPEPKRDTEASSDTAYEDGVTSYQGPRDLGADVIDEEEIQTGEYTQESLLGEPTNQDPEHARDLTADPELFSNIRCEYDYTNNVNYIGLRIYNVLDEDILISPKGVAKGYNTYFMIRGIVDKDPGCGTEVLHPGQFTECKKIGFDGEQYGNTPGINRISVEVPGKTEALLVDCPEFPVSDEE